LASLSKTSWSILPSVASIESCARFAQVVHAAVVAGHPYDRTVEQRPPLEAVQGLKRHHLGQVAGDPKDDEDIRVLCGVHVTSPGASQTLQVQQRERAP
jgi:hypothetical protein